MNTTKNTDCVQKQCPHKKTCICPSKSSKTLHKCNVSPAREEEAGLQRVAETEMLSLLQLTNPEVNLLALSLIGDSEEPFGNTTPRECMC